jgi:tetratricopeptide (TPR) repeat protein
LDYGADRDVHYLVMEPIAGKDLAAVLVERNRLPWQEALEVAAQVALALDAANAHSVVHRDIKPQNIMLSARGHVKVLDFGIARARMLPSLTQTGFVGSPSYISPEQAMGKQVDIRSDIYSLGIVLYETLTGHLPFDAPTPWSIISQHIAQEPPVLALADSRLPPPVSALVNKMLAKDPEDRFQTPGALLAALEAALRGPVSSAQGPTEPVRSVREIRRDDRAHRLLLSSLYERASEAAQAEEWPRAVHLFNQIIKLDPHYEDTSERLAHAGLQARLAALYSAAQDALAADRWQEAIDELAEIGDIDTDYKNAASLLAQARRSLADAQARAHVAQLYDQGMRHYQNKEWERAASSLTEVVQADSGYDQAARMLAEAQKRVRWAKSPIGRLSRQIVDWIGKQPKIRIGALSARGGKADEGD